MRSLNREGGLFRILAKRAKSYYRGAFVERGWLNRSFIISVACNYFQGTKKELHISENGTDGHFHGHR